jgi:hypothetical protein
VVASAVLALGVVLPASAREGDVLSWFSAAKRVAIESGRAVVDVVPEEGADVAVIGAVQTTADGERLATWFREIGGLQQAGDVPVIRRFSDPPTMADVTTLVLADDELEGLRECRPGRCNIKLSAPEMAQAQAAIRAAGRNWKLAAQEALRRAVLARARGYLAGGFAGAPPYEDQANRLALAGEIEALLRSCGRPGLHLPAVTDYLRSYPAARVTPESFLIWSKDTFGDVKPVIGVAHVSIFRGLSEGEPTVIATTQVFASHYVTASLSLTAVVSEPDGRRCLVYARRSRGDVFHGALGGLLRRIVQSRARAEGPAMLESLRQQLESGRPRTQGAR